MKVTLAMKLVRQARKADGDRYEDTYQGETLVIYFPQTISREGGQVKELLTVTVED